MDHAHETDPTLYPGYWSLTLGDAARLIAVDMLGSGRMDLPVALAESVSLSHHDKRVVAALKPEIDSILLRLITAVEKGDLATNSLERDWESGAINPKHTFLEFDELKRWCLLYGLGDGDWFHEWEAERDDIAIAVKDFQAFLLGRAASGKLEETIRTGIAISSPDYPFDTVPYARYVELQSQFDNLSREYVRLYDAQPADPVAATKSLTQRERGNLLRIIAALCGIGKLDLSTPYKAAAVVMCELQRLGLSLSDDTIAARLSDAADVIGLHPK